jgi:hypothetical protein
MSKLDIHSLPEKVSELTQKVSRYKLLIFVLFVAVLYGFIVLRINSLSNAQPSTNAIAAQSDPIKTAHIDKTVVQQLESLRDNNINVQTLFEEARNNPFQD